MHCGEVLNTFPAIAPVQEAVDAAFTKSYGREQQKISDAMRLREGALPHEVLQLVLSRPGHVVMREVPPRMLGRRQGLR